MARLVIGTSKSVVVPAIVKEVPMPTGKYQLLQRVKDDSNNEIGTVCGFHTDANDVEYAVVCLDAQYRSNNKMAWTSNAGAVANLPQYTSSAVYDSKETATFNCDKILAFGTSPAVSDCRSHSFTIGGTTYYGQLPNLCELLFIFMHLTAITNADTSSGTAISASQAYWSSNQETDMYAFDLREQGYVSSYSKTNSGYCKVIPILELPNALS